MRPFNYTTPFAFDDSVRSFTEDGHLRVEVTNISKANICPYVGKEIPGYKELGLNPEQIYKLYRDADELKKAADTFNQVPLLSKHQPVNALEFPQELVIGATGTDAKFDGTYLKNSLIVWTREDIDDIESAAKKELSSGYRYRADMTPGTLNGEKYDGVMRDIVGNHVALVREGRAGKDVVVGDSAEALKGANMTTKTGVTRTGFLAGCMLKAFLEPRMAMDTEIDLDAVVKGLTSKNLKQQRGIVLDELKKQLKGKLTKAQAKLGLDATVEEAGGMLDMLDGKDEEMPEEVADSFEEMEEHEQTGDDDPMAQVEAHLRKCGMGDDDVDHVMGLLKGGGDADPESFTEEANGDDPYPPGEERETEEEIALSNPGQGGGKDKRLGRDDPPPFKSMPEKGGGMDSKQVQAFAKDAAARAVKAERNNQRGIRAAEQFVRPWVGDLSSEMSFDSAEAVYAQALKMMGKDTNGIHPSALRAVLEAQPVPGAKRQHISGGSIGGGHAMDAAQRQSYGDRFPNAARIKVMG